MQLSLHADYGLRVLVYLSAHPGKVVATHEISHAYGISKNHLVRVVQTLDKHGYLKVMPGRSGGIRLAKTPGEIRLGEVVRDAEPSLNLVECFDAETNTCPIIGVCGLKLKLRDALEAFLGELNKYTLADLMSGRQSEVLAARFVQLH